MVKGIRGAPRQGAIQNVGKWIGLRNGGWVRPPGDVVNGYVRLNAKSRVHRALHNGIVRVLIRTVAPRRAAKFIPMSDRAVVVACFPWRRGGTGFSVEGLFVEGTIF